MRGFEASRISVPNDRARLVIKRLIDVVVAAFVLVILAPLLPIIVVLIRLDSRGPAIFRQTRTGQRGREFEVLKFRTMIVDAGTRQESLGAHREMDATVSFLTPNDPRVTRLGWYLRRSSLDELPQLLNVLWGDMSLVGPRPLVLSDCRRLALVDPVLFERRLAVRPGLTGLAQVSGRRSLSPNATLELDARYVHGCSLLLDLEILCRTVPAVLSCRGVI